ncbi:hypothetical protein DdX_10678 [Ditylenchus destructor]|uniref:Uncharacterized protein n=1 Tax=Ditylenchus destructor TaxID=166010 RepID=A0AAD4R5C6_9BILA|nr:hypothetical protein DdX_10678 [Ditylenchus destructor]
MKHFVRTGLHPGITIPQFEDSIILQKLWPAGANAMYINGGLAKKFHKLRSFGPKGNETLTIDFVSDPEAKYIFPRKGQNFKHPYLFIPKLQRKKPMNVEGYTFIIKSDVLGRYPITEVQKRFDLKSESTIPELEKAIREEKLWPKDATGMYINDRCVTSIQILRSFGSTGNEKLVIDFVEDSEALYTILVNNGKDYEIFKEPLAGPRIGPRTSIETLEQKLKKAGKWPEGMKKMLINGIKTCEYKTCDNAQLTDYKTDGLVKIDFV